MASGPVVDTTQEAPPRPQWTTLAAGLLSLLVTLPFAHATVRMAGVAWGDRDPRVPVDAVSSVFGNLGAGDVAAWYAIATIVTGAFVVWCVALGLGILARLEWARFGGILTFVMFGLMLTMLMVAGAIDGGEAPNRWVGFLVAFAEHAIVVLLVLGRTSDDIDTAHWFRQRRRDRNRQVRRFRRVLAPLQPEDFAAPRGH